MKTTKLKIVSVRFIKSNFCYKLEIIVSLAFRSDTNWVVGCAFGFVHFGIVYLKWNMYRERFDIWEVIFLLGEKKKLFPSAPRSTWKTTVLLEHERVSQMSNEARLYEFISFVLMAKGEIFARHTNVYIYDDAPVTSLRILYLREISHSKLTYNVKWSLFMIRIW